MKQPDQKTIFNYIFFMDRLIFQNMPNELTVYMIQIIIQCSKNN